jgi:hypothetical protein
MIKAVFTLVRSSAIAVLALPLESCDERAHPVAPASITRLFTLPTGLNRRTEPSGVRGPSRSIADTTPSLSFDSGTLLFTSNRPGGLGGNDLWLSTPTLHSN